jgi:1,2-phenylacetyl-CoA epoxidase catalytic subunit
VRSGILLEPLDSLRGRWTERVHAVLGELGITLEAATVADDGRTRRTEEFEWLHGQFTMVSASEEGATW